MPVPSWDELPDEIKQQFLSHFHSESLTGLDIETSFHAAYTGLFALDESDLIWLRTLMRTGLGTSQQGTLYYGVILALLFERYGICPFCNIKHDAELANMANPPTPEAQEEYETDQKTPTGWANLLKKLPGEYLNNLSRYSCELIPGQYPRIKCSKCRMPYVSLEDRMIRDPDDCSGCHSMNSQGVRFDD